MMGGLVRAEAVTEAPVTVGLEVSPRWGNTAVVVMDGTFRVCMAARHLLVKTIGIKRIPMLGCIVHGDRPKSKRKGKRN